MMSERKLVTRKELEAFLRLGENSHLLTTMMQEREFPTAVVLGDKSKRWYLDEIIEYLETKRHAKR